MDRLRQDRQRTDRHWSDMDYFWDLILPKRSLRTLWKKLWRRQPGIILERLNAVWFGLDFGTGCSGWNGSDPFWLSWILSWCRISPSLFRSSPCCPPKWSTWSRKTSWTCCPPKGSTWPYHRCGFIAFFTLGGLRCLSMFALKTCKLLQTIFCCMIRSEKWNLCSISWLGECARMIAMFDCPNICHNQNLIVNTIAKRFSCALTIWFAIGSRWNQRR